jgi:hypothetical protein
MCVNHLSWEASDGKKREVPLSSMLEFKKSIYFSVLYSFFVLTRQPKPCKSSGSSLNLSNNKHDLLSFTTRKYHFIIEVSDSNQC